MKPNDFFTNGTVEAATRLVLAEARNDTIIGLLALLQRALNEASTFRYAPLAIGVKVIDGPHGQTWVRIPVVNDLIEG